MPPLLLSTSAAFANPASSGGLASAVRWLEATLLGTVATTVAVIAVASVGYRMITGHLHYRRGLTVVAGCFVLFGAPTIAASLRSAADGAVLAAPPREIAQVQADTPSLLPLPPAQSSPAFDPYAGASVPVR